MMKTTAMTDDNNDDESRRRSFPAAHLGRWSVVSISAGIFADEDRRKQPYFARVEIDATCSRE
eukprot:90736-Rhodomonas_salina.2